MKRKRIGNDINIAWAIVTEDGKPFDLSRGKVSLYLKNYVRKEEVKGFSIEGNVILWTFLGKNQKNLGNHSLELVINEDAEGMITTDACDFVCLVPCSCKEGGEDDNGVTTETVNLTSVITLGGGSYDDTEIKEAIAELDETKQDTIEDLETIREGAKKGATAIQKVKTINGQEIVGEGNINIECSNINPPESADATYKSSIDNKKLEMPSAVGGLGKGTTIESLEGKTFSQMFDDILFPTVIPTFTAPTASLQFKNYASIKEVGSTAPTASDFTTGYNAGVIAINGVKQNNRGGSIDLASSFIYVNEDADNKVLPETVALGNTTFVYRASFAEGPQPKDNKGNNFGAPLAAGYVDSPAITLNGTYPWFASTASASEDTPVVKQRLVAWKATAGAMNTGEFELQPSGTLPQVFKLPRKISTLQMLNTVSNKMETIELGDYNETTETINIGGVDVTYYVYTYKGAARGSVTLLASF